MGKYLNLKILKIITFKFQTIIIKCQSQEKPPLPNQRKVPLEPTPPAKKDQDLSWPLPDATGCSGPVDTRRDKAPPPESSWLVSCSTFARRFLSCQARCASNTKTRQSHQSTSISPWDLTRSSPRCSTFHRFPMEASLFIFMTVSYKERLKRI